MNKNIAIIGAGYSSLSAACYLAQQGHKVTVYEKNDSLGGRSRQLTESGFTFDMGPSWYWMPDVFDRFFADFGKKASDYYTLDRLAPSYRVYFSEHDYMDMPTDRNELLELFESEEKGAGKALDTFLKQAEHNYRVAIDELVYRPGLSPLELVTKDTVTKVGLFLKSISSDVRSRFKSDKLRSILEFPVLFLGAKPSNTPAFYNFMNYADMILGTWYPRGGMFSVVKGMVELASSLGVTFHTNADVNHIKVKNGVAQSIRVGDVEHKHELIVSGADYAHTETLLDKEYRKYSSSYWENRTFAPSSLLFYIGLDTKVKGLLHHNLFFDTSFETHAEAIYDEPRWPEKPLFYANFPSMSDLEAAPKGGESCFFLIPIAPGLEDGPELRKRYFDIVMDRMRDVAGQDIRPHITYERSYCVSEFIADYNSYQGNAYGLANTLTQTAFLRPSIVSKKVKGLYFTGQLTVPGPGVPPSLISGKIVADKIQKDLSKRTPYAAAL